MTPAFVSTSSIFIFSLVVSISTNTETAKVMDKASTDGSFTIAQTQGMNRRADRRDTRQGCRHQEGAVAQTSETASRKHAKLGVVESRCPLQDDDCEKLLASI